ncbi:hypothetical protein BJ912DRAFT_994826 [Pholiota molesta]|nr:hypothetical protein BJ912DRAFT_994826 [Pholiota molesta]
MEGKKSLTATNLAEHQHRNCDLYIHNVYNPKALFKRGNDWEAVLYSWLDDSRLLLKVPANHFFITGLCFWPPQVQLTDRFVQAGSEPLKFGLAKPDLWRVIDAKLQRVSHHIQIYFYTLCLTPAFDAYLFRELPQVISLPFEKVNWHYNPLCRGCRYEPLGIIPNVSIDDAKEEGILISPAVEAARTRKSSKFNSLDVEITDLFQVVSRRNYTCPRREDIAVVISIVTIPLHRMPAEIISALPPIRSRLPSSVCCPASQFIPKLASLIRTIIAHGRTCSFRLQLQTHITHAALAPADNHDDDIRLCIGALAQGVSLLQTTFQPLLLSGALLSFLGKGKQTKAEYKARLARMGLPTDGTVEVLRKRIDAERRKEIGQLSKVVALKKEIERQLALPIPGYWDLPDCVSILLPSEGACPTDEEIFAAYKNVDHGEALDTLLLRRNHLIYTVLKDFRSRVVTTSQQSLCVNEAKILSHLFFMQQFEVLAKLTELWQSRIDGCHGAPTLEYSHMVQNSNGPEYIFRLVSGEVDVPAIDKDWALYDKLLVHDVAKSTDHEQPPKTGNTAHGCFTNLARGKWTNNILKVGDIYRLSPRLVDFNTSKILSSLFECDFNGNPKEPYGQTRTRTRMTCIMSTLLALITAPASFGKIHDAKKYVKTEAEIQKLFPSQHRAAQRILSNRLSIIWGPPGTGKTYTISLSLLRLLEVERRHSGEVRKIIFITAFTHSAIEACRSKLVKLMAAYRSIESLPLKWLDDVHIDVVNRGNDHPAPPKSGSGIHIYAGTLFQLSNFTKRHNMQLVNFSRRNLVGASLTRMHGRIIIAGDSEQLAPILSAQYPQSKSDSLFGSVLDCVMFAHLSPFREKSQILSGSQEEADAPASQNTVVQLTENFRLNPDLGEFVSTIYARQFKPQKVQARKLAEALKSLSGSNSETDIGNPTISCGVQTFLVALSAVMSKQPQTVLVAPKIHSIAPIISLELPTVQGEAAVAASIVKLLQRCSPHEDIFVATPHRIQREAVNAALAQPERFSSGSTVTVDTIERLQGSEAEFVICLFSLPRASTTDLSFLLERRRLNVAISRAKTLCILVTSDEVLCPSVKVLADAEIAKGFAFLKDYEKRAWSYKLPLNIDNFSQWSTI